MAQVGADCSPHSLDQDSGGPRGAASFVGRESLTEEAQSLHPGARAAGRPSRALCARGTGGPQPRQPPSGTADPRKPEGRESRRQRTVSRHHTATGVMLGEPAARAQQRRWEQPRPPPPPGQWSRGHLLPEPRVPCLAPGADRRLRLTRALCPAPAQLKDSGDRWAQERASAPSQARSPPSPLKPLPLGANPRPGPPTSY